MDLASLPSALRGDQSLRFASAVHSTTDVRVFSNFFRAKPNFFLEAGFEKLALNFLQQTWFWTFLKVQRSLSSTLLQNDCSKKIGLSSRGRACSKISAADVVLDLPQGEEVAKTSVRADHVESMKASGNLSIQPGAVSSQASVPARGLFQPGVVSRPGLLPSRRWFQAKGFSSQGRVFFC